MYGVVVNVTMDQATSASAMPINSCSSSEGEHEADIWMCPYFRWPQAIDNVEIGKVHFTVLQGKNHQGWVFSGVN